MVVETLWVRLESARDSSKVALKTKPHQRLSGTVGTRITFAVTCLRRTPGGCIPVFAVGPLWELNGGCPHIAVGAHCKLKRGVLLYNSNDELFLGAHCVKPGCTTAVDPHFETSTFFESTDTIRQILH